MANSNVNKKALPPIVIAAGGTGGHLFPALSLAETFKKKGHPVLFMGGNLSRNPFFHSSSFPYQEITCSRFSLRNPFFPFLTLFGMFQTFLTFKKLKPALLIGFGSYYTFPALLGARIWGLPYILHEQNSVPGRVNRFFSKSAAWTGIYFPGSGKQLNGTTIEVEMPLRKDFNKQLSKEQALSHYGFSADLPVLLVFGGSQGAKAINQFLFDAASKLKGWQVLHFTGDSKWTKKLISVYNASGVKFCVKDFEKEMGIAWKVADLTISRAGAASIAEQMVSCVPGLLIPYPYATDQHQEANADFMVEKVKGAVKWREQDLSSDLLVHAIEQLQPHLKEMRKAIEVYTYKRKLPSFGEEINRLIGTL